MVLPPSEPTTHAAPEPPETAIDRDLDLDRPFTPAEVARAAERLAQWSVSLQPADDHQRWLVEELVATSVRLDRCHEDEARLRAGVVERAQTHWDQDRRLAAARLARGLKRNPEVVSYELRQTLQGCELLIERWEGLGAAIEREESWNPEQLRLAFDLLGVIPALRGPVPWRSDETARDLVRRETTMLRNLIEQSLRNLDRFERESALSGLETQVSRRLAAFHRQEAALVRRMESTRKHLRECQRHDATVAEAERRSSARNTPGFPASITSTTHEAEPACAEGDSSELDELSPPSIRDGSASPEDVLATNEFYEHLERSMFRSLLKLPDGELPRSWATALGEGRAALAATLGHGELASEA